MSDDNSLVTSVVLNWNNYEDTARCLKTLLQSSYTPHSVILVDNASTDESFNQLQVEFPEINYIEKDRNVGFSAGMNAGIKEAINNGSEYVWLLNNDTIISDPDTLSNLVQHLEARSKLGAITPVVDHHPKTATPWFQQGLVNWKSGNSNHHQKIARPSRRDGDILYNDFVPFCSALVARSVFESVGMLPTPYFMYREDVEFCGQMLKSGYNIGTDLQSHIEHTGAGNSGGEFSPTPTYYTARNRWLLRRRMSKQTEWFPFLIDYARWFGFTVTAVIWNLQIKSLWALLRGTVDGICGNDGKGPYP